MPAAPRCACEPRGSNDGTGHCLKCGRDLPATRTRRELSTVALARALAEMALGEPKGEVQDPKAASREAPRSREPRR
jgi:hypothetical protein